CGRPGCAVVRTAPGPTSSSFPAARGAGAAADDDAADIADVTFVLATGVRARRPAEQCHVERVRGLVVRRLERDVIEPHRFPVRRVEWRRRAGFASGRRGPAILAAAVRELHVEAARILDVEALEVFAVVIGDGIETTFLQFFLDLLRVPRLDAPREAGDHGTASAATPAAATSAAAAGRVRIRWRWWWRLRHPAA